MFYVDVLLFDGTTWQTRTFRSEREAVAFRTACFMGKIPRFVGYIDMREYYLA